MFTNARKLILTLSSLALISLSCSILNMPASIQESLAPQEATTVPAVDATLTSTPPPTTTQPPDATPTERIGLDDDSTHTFRGNSARTGVFLSPGPKTTPSLLWRFSTGSAIWSSPAIDNGVAYFGSQAGLYAVDIHTGAEIWRFDTQDAVISSPTITDGMVYFGSLDGNLYALHLASGEEAWRFPTGDAIFSSPAVADGLVMIGSDDGFLYAVDTETGEGPWRFEVEGIVEPDYGIYKAVYSSPAISKDRVFFGSAQVGGASADLFFYALDSHTGQKRWEYPAWNFVTSPVVADGVVFYGSFGSLVGLDMEDGSLVYDFRLGIISAEPALHDGLLYCTNEDGFLFAYDLATGEEKWSFEIGERVNAGPAIADGVLYFGSEAGVIRALDSRSGEILWAYETGGWFSSAPVISDGVLYIGSGDGYLYAFQ